MTELLVLMFLRRFEMESAMATTVKLSQGNILHLNWRGISSCRRPVSGGKHANFHDCNHWSSAWNREVLVWDRYCILRPLPCYRHGDMMKTDNILLSIKPFFLSLKILSKTFLKYFLKHSNESIIPRLTGMLELRGRVGSSARKETGLAGWLRGWLMRPEAFCPVRPWVWHWKITSWMSVIHRCCSSTESA